MVLPLLDPAVFEHLLSSESLLRLRLEQSLHERARARRDGRVELRERHGANACLELLESRTIKGRLAVYDLEEDHTCSKRVRNQR